MSEHFALPRDKLMAKTPEQQNGLRQQERVRLMLELLLILVVVVCIGAVIVVAWQLDLMPTQWNNNIRRFFSSLNG